MSSGKKRSKKVENKKEKKKEKRQGHDELDSFYSG